MLPTITSERLAQIVAKAKAKKEAERVGLDKIDTPQKSIQELIADKKATNHFIIPTIIDPSARLEALRAKFTRPNAVIIDDIKEIESPVPISNISPIQEEQPINTGATHIDKDGKAIIYNTLQNQFVTLAESGESCVLIGAAGTGKTTCMQGALAALIQSGKIPALKADGHKYLAEGSPGCVIIAYTRRATNNIRRVLPTDLKNNAITAHKLLEYKPEFFEILDEEGNLKKTMRFLASRHEGNPLPPSIHTIVVEESSMLSVEMYNEIKAALQHPVQWILLGDINQLPPVFGSAVLGFRLLDLPTVELTEVYRQALESPIIRLAHRILSGKIIPLKEYPEWFFKDNLKIHAWKKKIGADDALRTLAEFFKLAYDKEIYNIDEDIILIPYNKACGTIELNKHIANHIARKTQRITYEVIAGFNRRYFSIGDKVLYDKEDAEIIDININAEYSGARFQTESPNLDYWGHNPKAMEEFSNQLSSSAEQSEADVDFLLEAVGSIDEGEDRVRKASHVITVRLTDTGQNVSVDTAAGVNNLLHAYALTVHKAQGSEWRKVYLCLHQSHATMMQRELLYTAVTRAKEDLYVICEPDSFTKGIERQRIKGNTLAEKAEFFKGKLIN